MRLDDLTDATWRVCN